MISFLVFIDTKGSILEIKWSNPVYAVSSRNRSILELFSEDNSRSFLEKINIEYPKGKLFTIDAELCLIDECANINIFLLPVDDRILVLGFEKKIPNDVGIHEDFREILDRFMFVSKDISKNVVMGSGDSVRFQFESIQELNSELVNTRRLLEKTNIKLNIVNQDLNNRLVKDALTGLISRYQYRTEIESVISSDPKKLGVFTFMDIDLFKQVNDTYGHQVGDKYLVEFSRRLNNISLPNTIKIRISGDEFGLFSYGYTEVGLKELEEIWNGIKTEVISTPIQVRGKDIPISVSAGMAIYGKDTNEIYEIIEFADFAMYNAKRKGKGCFAYFDKQDYKHQKGKPYKE